MEYIYKIYQSLNINVKPLVVYATIETKFQCAKNLPKTPRQKPAKNPLKIPQPKIQQKSFMITLTKNLLKILNNNKKPLISSNKTKTPSMSFELITVKYGCKCSLTGKNFSPGEQVYFNYLSKTFLDPVYYENMQSQINSSGVQSYFQRHQKLNKVTQKP